MVLQAGGAALAYGIGEAEVRAYEKEALIVSPELGQKRWRRSGKCGPRTKRNGGMGFIYTILKRAAGLNTRYFPYGGKRKFAT